MLRTPEQSVPSGFPTNETMEMERVLRAQLELQSRNTRCAPVWRIRAPRRVHTEPGGRRLLLGLGASVISLGCVGFVFKEDILLYISKQAAPFARKLSTALLANQAALASRRIPPQRTHARTFLPEAAVSSHSRVGGRHGYRNGTKRRNRSVARCRRQASQPHRSKTPPCSFRQNRTCFDALLRPLETPHTDEGLSVCAVYARARECVRVQRGVLQLQAVTVRFFLNYAR